ncbi:MAG: UvrD-helicase domain-containing protein [Lachnospiraceae bacterium]|nr:UvrD-helicase domain-containing protein [Lachnospiraceae bacterium]
MESLHKYHGNLFIVGDPDQTVYTWRGADVKYILDFDKDHADTRKITMMRNYRSTPRILAAANSLIDKNRFRMKKELIAAEEEPGESVLLHHAPNSEEEAAWIVDRIRRLEEEGVRDRDIAILYRAHYVTRQVEIALQQEEIPYRIYSGIRFYDRAEIKTAHSYLRLIPF